MKKMALLSFATASILMAGGYKIPETSLNGVALSAANIAHNKSADAAYYNPANMVFMEDADSMEVDFTYIGLDKINYKGMVSGTGPYDIDSKSESFIIPTIHYVSGKAGETRIGLSIVSPGGLSKRWGEEPARTSAEEFTVETVEINPSVAIPVDEKISFSFGFRILYTTGVVKSSGTAMVLGAPAVLTRDMKGDSFDYGYNLAFAYKPTNDLEIGLTYRSQINLTVEGDAKLSETRLNTSYDGDTAITIPLPASASAALAYTLLSKTTIEFVYERNMWSAYKNLDFDYDGTQGPVLEAIFGSSIEKNWKDTNTYRLGVTQELDKITLMGGLVYDETPVPEKTIGFELPDSNSFSVSMGGRYQIDKQWNVGLSALYSMREDRDVKNSSLDGKFKGGNVLIVSTGINYKF